MDWTRNFRCGEAALADTLVSVFLDREQTKTDRTREIPTQPNLAAWLAPYQDRHGPICPYRSDDALHRALRKVAKHAGLRWPKNVLRDSYISYRVAAGTDIKTVADEAGNSIQKIHQDYLKRTSRSQADAWFALFPNAGQKILPLFA
jgi:hypothetical protein